DSLHPLPLNFANAVSPVTPVSSHQFLAIVEDVRAAIAEGIYPTRIAKGSSGSYFCRNRAGEIVGVFKPKNEEPYGHLNPKWTKWAHRNCLPCCFGRSCLIPNLGYLSEAAASYMDRRLGLNVVPRTEVVELASPSFFYSARDRRAYARGKPLPPKLGSFQLFLTGFKDATTFFKEGYETSTSVESVGGATAHETFDSNGRSLSRSSSVLSLSSPAHPNNWSEQTQLEFQQGFERLVVLDYLIRNTDRGMDNWMIKYTAPATCSDVSEASTTASTLARGRMSTATPITSVPPPSNSASLYVAAIDNGLAFPFKHPDRWRGYPYGWANLPIARIPFSASTRNQILHFLTSHEWWRETLAGLERIFRIDPDFSEAMWRRQRSVIRGEGYNLAEAL
ncbi:phosphatidylinositol 3-/4-kinase, partial [Zopfochytrium polystomum]